MDPDVSPSPDSIAASPPTLWPLPAVRVTWPPFVAAPAATYTSPELPETAVPASTRTDPACCNAAPVLKEILPLFSLCEDPVCTEMLPTRPSLLPEARDTLPDACVASLDAKLRVPDVNAPAPDRIDTAPPSLLWPPPKETAAPTESPAPPAINSIDPPDILDLPATTPTAAPSE